MKKYINSITETIHSTPLLRLNKIEEKYNLKNKIFVKLEFLNPYGSVKDRIVLSMIEGAEEKGLIEAGKHTLIESSSGNTGIALAAVGRTKGYKVVILMPEAASIERRKLIERFGAELIIFPKSMGRLDGFEKIKQMVAEKENYVWLNQYENENNPISHYKNTAQEIWDSLDENVDIFVSGLGTGGTITGVGNFLKSKNKDIQIIGVEPIDKVAHKIEGLQPIQNTKDGFIPGIMDLDIMDDIIEIENEDAFWGSKELSDVEGLPVGISSGANLKAVLEVDKRYEGKNIVFIAQDNIFRYLSLL